MPMYQVKPLSQRDVKIDLPTCMYKLSNIHALPGSSCAEHALQVNHGCPGADTAYGKLFRVSFYFSVNMGNVLLILCTLQP